MTAAQAAYCNYCYENRTLNRATQQAMLWKTKAGLIKILFLQTILRNDQLLTIKEASEWATDHNGSTQVSKEELIDYYKFYNDILFIQFLNIIFYEKKEFT